MKIKSLKKRCWLPLMLVLTAAFLIEVSGQQPEATPARPAPAPTPKTAIAPTSPEQRTMPKTPIRSLTPVSEESLRTTIGSRSSATSDRKYGRVSLSVSRAARIVLGNRTTGRISVKGWNRDVVEAHAMSSRGDEALIVDQNSSGEPRIFVKADYADLDIPGSPTLRVLEAPPIVDGHPLEVHLEINVPRYTEIELIRVMRSSVEVSDVDTTVNVAGEKSSVILKRIAGAEVHTRSGNVEIESATGLVQVATVSGAIRVHDSRGAVRAVSIAGPIEIKCARGRIDVTNTEAPIELINIDGDVDAIATNSSVRLAGNIREDGRYYLKSMSGRVEMVVPANTHGFTATLSSYRGLIQSDFALKPGPPIKDSPQDRLSGRIGNGKAQITLDSFEGVVRLTKVPAGTTEPCK